MTVTELRKMLAKYDDPDDDATDVMVIDELGRTRNLNASIGESEDGETAFLILRGPWFESSPDDDAPVPPIGTGEP